MRRTVEILATLLVTLTLACACHEDEVSSSFLLDKQVRLEIKGYTVFRYDPLSCQLGFCRDKAEFRAHSDNMSDFYTVRLEAMPAVVGEEIAGSISWTTSNDLHNKKTTFEVSRIEGDLVWLWSASNRIAVVVRVLD